MALWLPDPVFSHAGLIVAGQSVVDRADCWYVVSVSMMSESDLVCIGFGIAALVKNLWIVSKHLLESGTTAMYNSYTTFYSVK